MKKILVVSTLYFVLTLHGLNATNSTVSKLKCHECTSLNNTRCGDPFMAEETLIECPTWGDMDAVLCRKLRQMVDTTNGKQIRITRSCGYLENPVVGRDEHCFKASFTASSSSRYCACDSDGCNAGETFRKFPSLIMIIMTVIYALFTLI